MGTSSSDVQRLAAGVAHDFNNILTVILANAELACGVAADHPASDELAEIRRGALEAAELVQQLLAFSGQQVLRPTSMLVDVALEGMATRIRDALGPSVVVSTSLAANGAMVMVDLEQIEIAVRRIATNAHEAMGGRGTFSVASAWRLSPGGLGATNSSQGRVEIIFTDTGPGMSPAIVPNAFEPYVTTKGVGRGTGLGLAVASGIVKQSGGTIEVRSAAGGGTAIHVTLPATLERHTAHVAMTVAAPPARADAAILVVEDDVQVRQIVARILTRRGYSLLLAEDTDDAIRIAKEHPEPIGLVMSDMNMPKLNGTALVSAIREIRPGIPALFVSGYTDDQLLRTGLLTGSARFLEKPFTADQLATAVVAALADGATA